MADESGMMAEPVCVSVLACVHACMRACIASLGSICFTELVAQTQQNSRHTKQLVRITQKWGGKMWCGAAARGDVQAETIFRLAGGEQQLPGREGAMRRDRHARAQKIGEMRAPPLT